MSEIVAFDYRHELTRFSVDTGRILLDFGNVKAAISSNAEIIETDGSIKRIAASGSIKAISKRSGSSSGEA